MQELANQTHVERWEFQRALKNYTVAAFDIESTSLNASFGHCLCASVKPIGEKADTWSIHKSKSYKSEKWNDRQLVVSIRNAIETCDMVVSWNGQEFDFPFLDQRLTHWGERRIGPVHHVDLLPIARRKLRMHSNRLDAVAEALGIAIKKTPLNPATWDKAGTGHKPSLNEVIEHNIVDVAVLEGVFLKMKTYIDVIYRKR